MIEKAQHDNVKEITDQPEAGIQDLFESDRYQQWLEDQNQSGCEKKKR